jgi:CRP-like cAMP-binding protein
MHVPSPLAPLHSSARIPKAVAGLSLRAAPPGSLLDFLAKSGLAYRIVNVQKNQGIYSQGDGSDAVFYIQKGRVKLSVFSKSGKEATIALLDAGQFVGEKCLTSSQPRRSASATAFGAGTLIRIEKDQMKKALRENPAFSDAFISFMLARNTRTQEDLIDQLFNSCEKRLARTLLLLARYDRNGPPETVIPKISHQTLAQIVGTTRSRINCFMNHFRELGYIDYGHGLLQIRGSLLNVILLDEGPLPVPAPAADSSKINALPGRTKNLHEDVLRRAAS